MAEAQLLEIEHLLNTATASLESQWEGLNDDALSEQITKYRAALTNVSRRLADLGGDAHIKTYK
jgi:hypothetical protein